MASVGSTEVLRQVDQFWSVLDDLCLNDPVAYRKFIEKQLKEGAEFCTPPEIHSCLRTEIVVSCKKAVAVILNGYYFNLLRWLKPDFLTQVCSTLDALAPLR